MRLLVAKVVAGVAAVAASVGGVAGRLADAVVTAEDSAGLASAGLASAGLAPAGLVVAAGVAGLVPVVELVADDVVAEVVAALQAVLGWTQLSKRVSLGSHLGPLSALLPMPRLELEFLMPNWSFSLSRPCPYRMYMSSPFGRPSR